MSGRIQQNFEGSSVEKWELDHGIVREVRDGVEYVRCVDWNMFQRKCEEDHKAALQAKIMEAQAEAYGV